MRSASSRTFPAATAAVLLLVAMLVPVLLATPADAADDRCLDFEFVAPTVVTDQYRDDPLFDLDDDPALYVRVQLTDGAALPSANDDPGEFDCFGSPLPGVMLTLNHSSGLDVAAAVTTDANGYAGPFPVHLDTDDLDGSFSVSTSVMGSVESTFASIRWYWWQHGRPGGVECTPYDFTGVPGETRPILVTVTDSWGDRIPNVPIDVTIQNTHPQTLLDGALTDANGQLTTSYVGTTEGEDYGQCWADLNDNDTNDYHPIDAGYGSAYASWVSTAVLAAADVEVDADSGMAIVPFRGTPPSDFSCNAEYFNDLNDGITDDTYDASKGSLPLNGVVLVCLAAETAVDYVFGREATLEIVSGPGELVDLDLQTSLGAQATAITNEQDGVYPHAVFAVRGLAPGTTTLRGSVAGVTDTDQIQLTWLAPAVADARLVSCTGGGWVQLPDNASIACTVTDGLGNPVSGVPVSWESVDSDGASSTSLVDLSTDANGRATAALASPSEGRTLMTVSVAVGDCDPPASANGPGAFDAGKPAAVCEVVVPITWSDDAPPTQVDVDAGDGVGDGESVEVAVSDDDGNPVDSVKVCVVITGANAGTYEGMTDDDGLVSVDLPTAVSGDDLVEVFADLDGDGECDATAVLSEAVQRDGVLRFAGTNRTLTAVLASQERFQAHAGSPVRAGAAAPREAAGAVVLARQDDFADALAGTPLAAANSAPLLLTPTADLHADTLAEIDRVLADGGTVYLLGGEAALSPAVEAALSGRWDVERIGGTNRYETAVLIAGATTATPAQVLVTTGTNFADALTAGAAASKVGGVVVLSGDGAPTDVTTAYLAAQSGTSAVAIGGPAARAYPDLDAISGTNRFETGLLVAQEYFDAPTEVGIARGYAFPDGLSGGAHIGNLGGPLLLVRGVADVEGIDHPDNLGVKQYLLANAGTLHTTYVYGGAAAVAEVFTDQLLAAID